MVDCMTSKIEGLALEHIWAATEILEVETS